MRFALGIEYDGSNYHGWQCQPGLKTIQTALEEALTKVAAEKIAIVCAGRTDVGVHATGQVIHFETSARREKKAWIFGVNNYLPSDIRVQWAEEMPEGFHARFSAISRHYRYYIYNKNTASAILPNKISWCPYYLNEKKMHEAALHLLGEHDFSSFRGQGCQAKTANRFIKAISVERKGLIIVIDVQANAFLLHMVRNIVGVLWEIGAGKKEPIWAKEVLLACDRTLGGKTASAAGLYLTKVHYPPEYILPQKIEYGAFIF